MSVRTGTVGLVKTGTNTVSNLSQWVLDANFEILDTTSFGEEWDSNVPGVGAWTGSAVGYYNDDDTNGQAALETAFLAKTAITLKLYVDAVNYYTGSCWIEKLNITDDAKGIVKVTFNFRGNGALSKA
jgi:predicted secreted protein